ncbi:MAG: transketolase [Clostridia bacterium]
MDKRMLFTLKKQAVVIRKHIIDQVYHAKSGHIGGSLSSTDIMTFLYFNEMKVNAGNPLDPDRDRFVLSKGHCTPALYAILAEKGFFPREELKKFRRIDSFLQGHPSMKDVPGVDMSTGSLGQGISASVGMAIVGKADGKSYRVYCIIGDGELQEGQVWEAFMAGAHYKLDNLTVFLDHNGLQIDGKITDIMSPECVILKFKAFNWNVLVIDGHDLEQIEAAVQKAKQTKGKPTVIVAQTVKGKGVSFMENKVGWHGVAPNEEERNMAIKELDEYAVRLEEENNG